MDKIDETKVMVKIGMNKGTLKKVGKEVVIIRKKDKVGEIGPIEIELNAILRNEKR